MGRVKIINGCIPLSLVHILTLKVKAQLFQLKFTNSLRSLKLNFLTEIAVHSHQLK